MAEELEMVSRAAAAAPGRLPWDGEGDIEERQRLEGEEVGPRRGGPGRHRAPQEGIREGRPPALESR